MKGQAKEAVGRLTDDKDLQAEGKADRQAGEARETVGQAEDRVEAIVEKIGNKAGEMTDRTKDTAHRD